MQLWPVIHELVNVVFQANHLEEGYLQKVHGDIELEHVRGKDDIGIVELHNDEDTVWRREEVCGVEWARTVCAFGEGVCEMLSGAVKTLTSVQLIAGF